MTLKDLYTQHSKILHSKTFRYGIECGNGWFDIIHTALRKIEELYLEPVAEEKTFKLREITEKYGRLHIIGDCKDFVFYKDCILPIIKQAGQASYDTCEHCGKPLDFSVGRTYRICPIHGKFQ